MHFLRNCDEFANIMERNEVERYSQIGTRIRQARQEAGLSQEELGRRLGISGVAVGHYERGTRSIGIHELERLAQILERPLTWFLHQRRPWRDVVDAAFTEVAADPSFPHGARHDVNLETPFKEYIVRLYEKARNRRLLPTEEERLDYD